jgi:hypothetical protein
MLKLAFAKLTRYINVDCKIITKESMYNKIKINTSLIELLIYLLFPTLIPLSGVGTACFHHVVIKIRQLFLRPAATSTYLPTYLPCQPTYLETGVSTNDCKCSRKQRLNMPSETQRSSR